MYCILYVDDEPGLLEIGKLFLERGGQFIVDTITSGPEALALLDTKNYDAIIADYQMPNMDGIELLKTIRSLGKSLPFILFTGRGREEVVIQALNEGVDFYLQKGGEPKSQFAELSNKVRYAVMRRRAEDALKVSEERYRRIVETTAEGIIQMDEAFTIVYANRRMAEMLGYTAEEMMGRHISSLIAPEEIPDDTSRRDERRKGKSGRFERRFVTKEGQIRRTQMSATPVMAPDGTFQGSFAMCSDITERKTAEEVIARKNEDLQAAYEQLTAGDEELRQNYDELAKSQKLLEESEQRYRNVVEDQSEFISRFLPDGTHVFVNGAYCRYFEMNREDIIGHRFRPKIPPEDRECVKRFFASLSPSHPTDVIEHRIIMPDGALRWQRWSDRAIYDPSGKLIEYQSVGRDITREVATKAALEESETRFRRQYQNNPLAIFTWQYRNDDFVLVDYNTAAETLSGGRAHDYLGITTSRLYAGRPDILSKIRHCFAIRGTLLTECTSEHFLPGKYIHASAAFIPPDLIQVHLEDITERKKAEDEIRESEEKFRTFVENADDIIYSITPTGIYSYISPQVTELLGYEPGEWIGKSAIDLIHPDDLPRNLEFFRHTFQTGEKTSGLEYRIRHKDGTWLWHSQNGSLMRDAQGNITVYTGISRDITRQKKTEESLLRANRQLSLLSGITRHDILNRITGIHGYLELAEMNSSDPTLGKYLGKIRASITDIQSQIEFTRVYQDIGNNAPQWVELDSVIPWQEVPATITLTTLDIPNVEVFADPLLKKVFFNLLDNSVRHGQRVTIIRVSARKSKKDLVVIWEDNGIGVAVKEKERIFESGLGKNMGFGMFLIREILSLTGITIRETGVPGNGARFEITVPEKQYRISGRKTNALIKG
ncbi:PAS domain S-box protein [Methanoregula sp.]|uniref:response regulator n=1 Tax=Methanoregula sp. TaxID=2052170 RepID=UPI0035685B0B